MKITSYRSHKSIHLVFLPLLAVVLGLFYYLTGVNSDVTKASEQRKLLERKYELINKLEQTIMSAETNQRGFLLTDSANYLNRYTKSVEDYKIASLELRKMSIDGLNLSSTYTNLQSLVNIRFDELRTRIDEFREKKISNITESILLENNDLPRQIKENLELLINQTELERERYNKAFEFQKSRFDKAVVTSCAISFVAILFVYIGALVYFRQQSLKRAANHFEISIARNQNDKVEGVSRIHYILQELLRFIPYDIAAIYFKEEDHFELLASSGLQADWKPTVDDSMFRGQEEETERRARTLIKCRTNHRPRVKTGSTEVELSSVALFPLVELEEVIGFVELARSENEFSREEMHFLDEVSLAISACLSWILRKDQLNLLVDESRQYAQGLKIKTEELEAANLDLEDNKDKLRELNAKLQEEALKYENMANVADKANQAKSKFLANISHDIRTPLNAIFGYAQLIELDKSISPEKIKEFNVAIMKNGELLISLINDILDFSKIESGAVDLTLKEVNLQDFLQTIDSNFRLFAESKGLRFEVKISENVPDVFVCDKIRVIQILNNLVSNAVKFTNAGYVRVDWSYHRGQIVVEVKDTGSGIPESIQDKIFEPFESHQADGGEMGTGLGLAISRSLSRKMNGDLVLAHSTELEGSNFRVSFDAEQVSACSLESQVKSSVTSTLYNLSGKHLNHVLVVDDSGENRRVLKTFFAATGTKVTEACDGQECLDEMKKIHFDLVILDLQMPVMDGFETMQNIQRMKDRPTVIALTATALPEVKKKCLEYGFKSYFTKPVDFELLSRFINSPQNFNLSLSQESQISKTSIS